MGDFGLEERRAIKSQLGRLSLTEERERELLIQYQVSESASARQAALVELWESHSKLVVGIAKRYRRSGFELLDLVGAGHLGLYTAISRFDTSLNDTRLSSFASAWIRWSISDYIRRNASVMRLPESNTHRQLYFMREKLISDARASCIRDGVEPTDAEIHERIGSRIGMSTSEVENGLSLLNGGVVSLNSRSDDDEASGWEDSLQDDSVDTEDDVIRRLDRAKAQRRVMELANDILGERERIVFFARGAWNHETPATLDSLAERFGVSRERIHQLETSARRKITTALTNEGYARPVEVKLGTRAARPKPGTTGSRPTPPVAS